MRPAPLIPIELDKPRKLLLDLNAMVLFEEKTGKTIWRLNWRELTAKDLRVILWACLVHEDPQIAVEDVGKWIHAGSIPDIQAKLAEALKAAMPDVKEEAKAESPLANGTG